ETLEILGRAASAAAVECAVELSIITRWQIGGNGGADNEVAATPFFGLGAGQKGGTVELSGVSFTDLANTHTISAATLTMHYWDELSGHPTLLLLYGVLTNGAILDLASAGSAAVGSF